MCQQYRVSPPGTERLNGVTWFSWKNISKWLVLDASCSSELTCKPPFLRFLDVIPPQSMKIVCVEGSVWNSVDLGYLNWED